MDIVVFTTGGTIDKVYFDALSRFEVGETASTSLQRLEPEIWEITVALGQPEPRRFDRFVVADVGDEPLDERLDPAERTAQLALFCHSRR
jgi:hypothetical protein